MTGVYIITCIPTGKHYIGSSSRSVEERMIHHRKLLRGKRHHSILLQRAWDKYGEAAFEFSELEEHSPELCVAMEQHWLDMLQTANPKYGFNICPRASSSRGRVLRKLQKKRAPMPPEFGAAVSARLKGVPKSKEHAKAVGAAKKIPITQLNLDGSFVKVWPSAQDIQDVLGYHRSNINRCCKNTRPTAHGFKWQYADNGDTQRDDNGDLRRVSEDNR